ncbi:CG0192-related protein [Pseudonocardia sp. DLS-67]
MAVIHRAQITPTKAELVAGWLPSRAWASGADAPFELLGAYRFDDLAGEVGIETHLVRAGNGDVLQVPLTYRGAPLDGAGHHLIGTMEHSHLGRRWVYDGCGDPAYVAAAVAAIRTGGREAEEWVETDGAPVRRAATAHVTGSGSPDAAVPGVQPVQPVDGPDTTTVGRLVVLRVVGRTEGPDNAETLTGTWRGSDGQALLAYLPG